MKKYRNKIIGGVVLAILICVVLIASKNVSFGQSKLQSPTSCSTQGTSAGGTIGTDSIDLKMFTVPTPTKYVRAAQTINLNKSNSYLMNFAEDDNSEYSKK